MSYSHQGRVAIVTGGSGGIGQAIAVRLAKDGAKVGILDIADCDETQALIAEAGGTSAFQNCDLSDSQQVAEAIAAIGRSLGATQILVHCAAYQVVRDFNEISWDEWRLTQSVNQDSMFHMLKAVLPDMRANQFGRIIAIASSTFFIGGNRMAHYVTSKGALIGLVHGLAEEIGDFGITINAVAPGLTKTPKAVGDLPAEFFDEMAQQQAIKRSGTPEDQAGVVSFLASDDAGFITGQTILADGGQGRT